MPSFLVEIPVLVSLVVGDVVSDPESDSIVFGVDANNKYEAVEFVNESICELLGIEDEEDDDDAPPVLS